MRIKRRAKHEYIITHTRLDMKAQSILLLFLALCFFCSCSTSTRKGTNSVSDGKVLAEIYEAELKKTLNVVVMALPASGHMSPLLAVGEELVRRGHNVTFITTTYSDSENKTREKVRRLGMTYMSAGESIMLSQLTVKGSNSQFSVFGIIEKITTILPDEIHAIMEYVSNYLVRNSVDVIVGEDFLQTVLLCLANQKSIKTIMIGTTLQYQPHTLPSWPWPGLLSGAMSDDPSFLQRWRMALMNVAFKALFSNILIAYVISPIQDYCPSVTLTQASTAPGVYIPHIVPSVIGFEYPRTISPLTTYVGPILTKSPDPIPKELQEWLDSKEDQSVVYVSMGSLMNLNKEKGYALLNGVLSTNYSLMWALKTSNQDILNGVEINDEQTYISSWAPQLAVLGHRAVRIAIVHGGMNGIHEALYNEIPLIVMPFSGDQMSNAGRVHHHSLGIHLQESDITVSGIADAIKRVDEGNYRENVKHLKKSFVDAGGVERAADLIELYDDIGYSHLIPAYAQHNWSWVQYYNADLYTVLVLLSILVCVLIVRFGSSFMYRNSIKEKEL